MSRLPAALAVGVAAVALAVPVALAAPASAAGTDATVTVVHGVRGLVADVRIDGNLVLSGFAPERVTDALTLPAGDHRVQVWRSGAAATDTPLLDQSISLTPAEVATAGIGLGPDGNPLMTVFDDATLAPAGGSAIAVRGLAATEAVNVVAGDRTLATGLLPTQQSVQQVPPATYPVSVVPMAGGAPVLPPQDVPVVAGRAVVLYLIGSQADATLGWVAQTVVPAGAAGAAPARIDTGFGPVPAAGDPATTALVLGLPLGLLGLVALRRRQAA